MLSSDCTVNVWVACDAIEMAKSIWKSVGDVELGFKSLATGEEVMTHSNSPRVVNV